MTERAGPAGALPPLRGDVDFLPSPDGTPPGLILRDPMGYATAVLRVPAVLVPALACLDGQQGMLDCQAALAQRTGEIVPGEAIAAMVATLREAGFLLTPELEALRARRQAEFAAAPVRAAAHAGGPYPGDEGELRRTLDRYLAAAEPVAEEAALIGLAAPHVSPFGGVAGYAAAYARLPRNLAGKTLAILGTSHHGAANRFGLTRKPFATPLGLAAPDREAVEFLAANAGPACAMEDYCHAIEHSIEFQVVFAQYRGADGARVLPILCGPLQGAVPEAEAFYAALGELAARRGRDWFWLLGVDLAHIGVRYGGASAVQAGSAAAREVERRDRERLGAVLAGEAEPFRRMADADLTGRRDGLNWCGSSALYAFLRAAPPARGELLHYGQWNIDAHSIVSYAAIAWRERNAA
ncbi:MAG: AmmeMemoRadiSam system protein B [Terriglobales bacterium]